MTFMPWSEELTTGIQSIDEQHRWLVDATNRLYDEINQAQPDSKRIGEILEGLIDYTYNHFITEEDLFKRFGYPESAGHLAEHNRFTATAADLLSKFEDGASVNNEAMSFLKDWLVHHIMEVDMAYVPFMKEQGIE